MPFVHSENVDGSPTLGRLIVASPFVLEAVLCGCLDPTVSKQGHPLLISDSMQLLLLACVLGALLSPQHVSADPTDQMAALIRAKKDPPGCGNLGAACCMKRSAAAGGKCNSANLACYSPAGGELTCNPCGVESTSSFVPACAGRKCDKGLVFSKTPDGFTCVPGDKKVPSDAYTPLDKSLKGAARMKALRDKMKRDNKIGKSLGMGGCAGDSDCQGGRACVKGVCSPCGAPGQPCCSKGAACRSYGGVGSAEVLCEFDVTLKFNMCNVRQPRS